MNDEWTYDELLEKGKKSGMITEDNLCMLHKCPIEYRQEWIDSLGRRLRGFRCTRDGESLIFVDLDRPKESSIDRLLKQKEERAEEEREEISQEKEEAIIEFLERGYSPLQVYYACRRIKNLEVTLEEIRRIKTQLEAKNE